MKNSKAKILSLGLSASFVLSAMAPAVASANAEPVNTSYYTQINPNAVNPEKIKDIIDRAEDLIKVVNKLPIPGKGPYVKALEKIIGALKNVDPSKAGPRVQLASESIEAIRFSINDIQGKTKKAHVEIGLQITKAALTLADPYASNEKLEKANEQLKEAMNTAKESADITDEDVATIYVKKDLNKLIDYARKLKLNNKELTKEEKAQLSDAIKKAVHTKNKARVTVAEINQATEELQSFLENLLTADDTDPDQGEVIDPEFNEEDPEEVEEPVDEETEEESEQPADEETEETEEESEQPADEEAEETEEESEQPADEEAEETEEESEQPVNEEIPEAEIEE
ncbi:cAMP factor [Anaerococcus octavius]|uniref:cAMP factor n=1 Tax=Anaerococcus octavius TaxID=54007 RepID=A0A380WT04_9FIRM|nr:CAMP factor family pore-forming toxin [Anaerococcus octavius]SUU92076.1 cAMP factor [Anaerococcus octavius]